MLLSSSLKFVVFLHLLTPEAAARLCFRRTYLLSLSMSVHDQEVCLHSTYCHQPLNFLWKISKVHFVFIARHATLYIAETLVSQGQA